jgi:hypothetical protein
MKLEVIDKETNKSVWVEEHSTIEESLKALNELKINNYNPEFFKYFIDGKRY